MKDMADRTNMAASVLSSLYSSVLPTYIRQVKEGIGEEEALDYALSQVNNVSKKRLLGSLKELKEQLYQLEPAQATGQKDNPMLALLAEEMARSTQDAYNYSGIYMSYSLSSSRQALKAEPYLICPSENSDYVKVVHNSAYNLTHYGTCLFSNHQNAYLFFNEREAPQIALFTIYLQLPMYDFPHLLKGLYLSLDYNRNPIARRILFVKHSDSTSMDLHLPERGLHQDLLRPLAPPRRKRFGAGEEAVGDISPCFPLHTVPLLLPGTRSFVLALRGVELVAQGEGEYPLRLLVELHRAVAAVEDAVIIRRIEKVTPL